MPVSLYDLPTDVKKVYFHTGNMIRFPAIVNNVQWDHTQQIVESIKICLETMEDKSELIPDEDKSLTVRPLYLYTQKEEEKKTLQTNVKLFITHNPAVTVREAIEYTLEDLNFERIGTLMLSYPKTDASSYISDLLAMWIVMEEFVLNGKVFRLGISDIEAADFQQVHSAAQRVKPAVTQIRLEICCDVPPDLQNFCNEHSIEILTHRDSPDILPVGELKPIFQKGTGELYPRYNNLEVRWVTRFLSFIPTRGILRNRGYMMELRFNDPDKNANLTIRESTGQDVSNDPSENKQQHMEDYSSAPETYQSDLIDLSVGKPLQSATKVDKLISVRLEEKGEMNVSDAQKYIETKGNTAPESDSDDQSLDLSLEKRLKSDPDAMSDPSKQDNQFTLMGLSVEKPIRGGPEAYKPELDSAKEDDQLCLMDLSVHTQTQNLSEKKTENMNTK